MNDKRMNPQGKPVILYAPNYNGAPGKDIEGLGAIVVRTPEELKSAIDALKVGK
jgi:hypothetical protein